MRKVLIFTAHIEHPERISVNPEEYDWILCADAGYIHAQSIGIRPDMIIGDFDSAGRAPSDSGIPFDPTQRPEADITLPAEDRAIGGLGIHLVRQIMDDIHYERKDNRNILTLAKKL